MKKLLFLPCLLALGLLAEMQVRYHHEDRSRRLVSDATIIRAPESKTRAHTTGHS